MKAIAVFLCCCVIFAQAKLVPKQLKVITRGGIETTNLVVGQGSTGEEEQKKDLDIFEINKDLDLRDGDIASSNTRNSLVDENRHWPEGVPIPVSYKTGLNLEAIATIEEARREYELRTCLSFVDRTNQKNYIMFDALSGCYSSVGEVGGSQTISIGSGCERMSTVIHEIMHAIGIYHEQSRTDRDDYVRIALENVDSGKEHNFNTYKYDFVDDRRVSYDYNSVMHYGDTSFSNNGLPTIVTHDPAFQDTIGQRRTFSEGDVTKINRMYNCGDTVRPSYTCDFENSDVCGYVQETTSDQADWFRYTVGETPPVVTSINVPDSDGSFGVSGKGSYMLFDSSNSPAGEVASMRTMRFLSVVPQQCLEFSYYMNLATGSGAVLNVYIATIDPLSGDILDLGSPVTTLTIGDSDWNSERLTIEAPMQYKLVFEVTSGGQSADVIAIDDVNVIDKPCETNYFVIKNYREMISSALQGDYLYSPVFYTAEGYAFQLLVYPVGSSSATPGYMSMYFMLAQGVNDNTLKWPFYNRLIKLSVVDQQSNTLTRMNQFSNYLTEAGGPWEQPTSSRNSGWGYRQFMSLSEITNTRNFVKHNSLMISIDITDMTPWTEMRSGQTELVRPSNSMYMAKSTDQHHQHDHDHHDKDVDIELNPCQQQDSEKADTVSESAAVVIAASCGAIVFVLMVFVLFAFNYQHQKQMGRFFNAFMNRSNPQQLPDYNSACYAQKSGEVNLSMTT